MNDEELLSKAFRDIADHATKGSSFDEEELFRKRCSQYREGKQPKTKTRNSIWLLAVVVLVAFVGTFDFRHFQTEEQEVDAGPTEAEKFRHVQTNEQKTEDRKQVIVDADPTEARKQVIVVAGPTEAEKEAHRVAEQTEDLLTRYVPEMLTRVGEFKININCRVNFSTFALGKKKVIYSSDLAKISSWEKAAFDGLHQCIKNDMQENYSRVWPFLYQLFATVQHPITKGGTERRWGYLTDEVFAEHVGQINADILTKANTVQTKYVSKWEEYTLTVLPKRLAKGRKEERKWDKELADQEFREEHGYGRNETCIYDDGNGERRYRCLDGLPQDRADPNTSWIGEMADEANRHSQKQAETARILQHARQIELRLWSESQKQQTRQKPYQSQVIQNNVVVPPPGTEQCIYNFGAFNPDATEAEKEASRVKSTAHFSAYCKAREREIEEKNKFGRSSGPTNAKTK